MKKIFITLSLVLIGFATVFGQAKKPTIMVVPSDNWCIKNGYTMEFDDEGTKVTIPDYKTAFQQNISLYSTFPPTWCRASPPGPTCPLTCPSTGCWTGESPETRRQDTRACQIEDRQHSPPTRLHLPVILALPQF